MNDEQENIIQSVINKASATISIAAEKRLDEIASLKILKKYAMERLKNDNGYIIAKERQSVMRSTIKDMQEQLRELEKTLSTIENEDQSIQEINRERAEVDIAFADTVSRVTKKLADDLNSEGINALVEYKNGKISLTVIKV